jgi:hypothetical protein
MLEHNAWKALEYISYFHPVNNWYDITLISFLYIVISGIYIYDSLLHMSFVSWSFRCMQMNVFANEIELHTLTVESLQNQLAEKILMQEVKIIIPTHWYLCIC